MVAKSYLPSMRINSGKIKILIFFCYDHWQGIFIIEYIKLDKLQ